MQTDETVQRTHRVVIAGVLALSLTTAAAIAGNIYASSATPYSKSSGGLNMSDDMRHQDRYRVRLGYGWSYNNYSFPYRIRLDGVTVDSGTVSVFGNFGFGSTWSGTLIASQGVHVIEGEVDYLNQIIEDDETDNYVARTVTVTEASAPIFVSLGSDTNGASLTVSNLLVGVNSRLQQSDDLRNPNAWTQALDFVSYTRTHSETIAPSNLNEAVFFKCVQEP